MSDVIIYPQGIECDWEELDNIREKLFEDGYFEEYVTIPVEGTTDSVIDVGSSRIIIPKYGLSAREGDYCMYDEESGYFMPDFSLTLLYEEDEEDPANFLYWEQDPIPVALHNFLHFCRGNIDGQND